RGLRRQGLLPAFIVDRDRAALAGAALEPLPRPPRRRHAPADARATCGALARPADGELLTNRQDCGKSPRLRRKGSIARETRQRRCAFRQIHLCWSALAERVLVG